MYLTLLRRASNLGRSMKKIIIITGVAMVFALFGCGKKNQEEKFWSWFEKNQEMLFNFEKDTESIFDRLAKEMNKVDPELTFEFGPVENGKREFVISAGGIKDSFPKVESLYDSAPKLDKWIFIKFRPRRKPMGIEMGGKNINPDDLKFQLFRDEEKVGIMVFFDGYNEDEKNLYGQIGFLMLDQALGEYDVETKVGFIEFVSTESKYYEDAHPLTELQERFDNFYKK